MKKNKRDFSEANRRQYPRLKPSAVPFLKSVAFNQGGEARVINISRGGILLETEVRLRPQMKLFLKLVTSDGVIKMEGHVLRSSISSLSGVPRYQSAIEFEHPFHMLDDLSAEMDDQKQVSQPESTMPFPVETARELQQIDFFPDGTMAGNSAVLTVIAKDGLSVQEVFTQEMLKQNDW